jgi:hypothetical protein
MGEGDRVCENKIGVSGAFYKTPGSTSTTRSIANLEDGFVAFKDGNMVLLRIPYPMGFYAKGLDGRIDDPAAGWKDRGLWSTNGDRTPWLMENRQGIKAARGAHPNAS